MNTGCPDHHRTGTRFTPGRRCRALDDWSGMRVHSRSAPLRAFAVGSP